MSSSQKPVRKKSRPQTLRNAMKKAMNKEDYPVKQRAHESAAESLSSAEGSRGADRAEKDNVEKIRDLIFGTQMRTYEQRFSRFEERLLKETVELREENKRRIAAVESYVKGELAAIQDRQKADQAAGEEALKEATRDWKESVRASEKRVGLLEEQNSKAQRELRQLVLDESKRLSEEMEQRQKELQVYTQKQLQELRDNGVDRLALADLLSEVALRLKAETSSGDKR